MAVETMQEAVERLLIPRPKSILEIGSGSGRLTSWVSSLAADYDGIDVDANAITEARKAFPNLRFHTGSAEAIPLTSRFSVVMFTYSWHYIKDFDKALQELNRVLATKGIVVIIEPTEDANWYDSRLQKTSPDFVPELLNEKMKAIHRARASLGHSHSFTATCHQFKGKDVWVLRRRVHQ